MNIETDERVRVTLTLSNDELRMLRVLLIAGCHAYPAGDPEGEAAATFGGKLLDLLPRQGGGS